MRFVAKELWHPPGPWSPELSEGKAVCQQQRRKCRDHGDGRLAKRYAGTTRGLPSMGTCGCRAKVQTPGEQPEALHTPPFHNCGLGALCLDPPYRNSGGVQLGLKPRQLHGGGSSMRRKCVCNFKGGMAEESKWRLVKVYMGTGSTSPHHVLGKDATLQRTPCQTQV